MSDIKQLKLSARAENALEAAEVKTVEDLKALDDAALNDIKGLGPKAIEEVKKAIASEPESEGQKPDEEEPEFAKAGKRSKKAAEEAEAAAKKEARKERIASGEEEPEAPKRGPVPKTRSRLERRAKNYRKSHEMIKQESYELKSAVALAIKTSTTNFDGSIEVHINLNVDPTHADQNIRNTLVLPNGTGKTIRVAVFTTTDNHKDAKAAGADIVAADDFLDQLKKGELNFDVLIASPDVMAKLGQYAKVLGPKGLMPNPKSGTVTKDVVSAVKQAKAGKIEYRVDSRGIVHTGIGKVSFGADKVLENAQALLDSVKSSKPSSVKGPFIERISMNATMGPGIKVQL